VSSVAADSPIGYIVECDPSNSSMNYEPNNTTAQFVTKLTEVIELEGNWEVELMEIMIPCTSDNVGNGSFYYMLLFDAQPSTIHCEMSSSAT